ncbi:unnamed protein product [Coffea canephora]|uniref:Uncharacterized protein n=1 Tax=Coffea canephora TaxID=49390 RepID=A0A068UIU1_COFCA|nr:unnamed protein product [Coffea canephora]
MEAKMAKFFESVGNFFSGGDQIPWCDSDIVAGCEREVAEAEKGSTDELKSECIMRLSWALVHSKRPEDVQRGIAMLEGQFGNDKHGSLSLSLLLVFVQIFEFVGLSMQFFHGTLFK